MPPKGSRGSTTRGRGRGRGKASAPAPASASASADNSAVSNLLGESSNEQSSQSALEDSSNPIVPTITSPQQHLLDDSAVVSPNSSPVSIPTETPAPTPARAAAAAIPRSEPAPTIASSSSHGHGGEPSVRGGRGGARGGAKPAAMSRFKPKNVRSDASKLEEIAKKEEAKANQLAMEKAREQARLLRGRGRPARGRGDVMGRRTGTATGAFSIAPEALRSNPEFASKSMSGGGGGGGGSGLKREGGAGGLSRSGHGGLGGGKGGSGGQHYEPRYPDQDDDAPRIDIETINLVSDDEGSYAAPIRSSMNGRRSSAGSRGGLRPVRLDRKEHKERVTIVNTETIAKPPPEDDDEDLPTIDELRSAKAAPNQGPLSPTRATFIKHEIDDDDVDNMEVSFRAGKVAPSASPDAKRKLKESLAHMDPIQLDLSPDVSAEEVAKAKQDKKQRHHVHKKVEKKPVIQTAQDREEYERHLEDVAILARELGGVQGNFSDKGKEKDIEGDVDMDDPTAEEEDRKSGRLYLFQFPPVLPELYNPIHGKPKTSAEIKTEEVEKAEERKKADEGTKGKGKAKALGADAEEPEIKIEASTVLSPEERKRKEEVEKRNKRQGFVKEEGYIGKLVVRESGRVELCWGGTSLLVGRGVDAGFLTTGVVVDSQERGPPGGGAPEGKAMGMGKIMGKFVVTPDWQKMT